MKIVVHTGERAELRPLFELADEPGPLERYFLLGEVLAAREGERTIGHLQLVPTGVHGVVEVTNTAVVESHRGTGVGRRLMERAFDHARSAGYATIEVATGACDVGNLRFYQRLGFRMASIERDVFTPENGYPPTMVDGVPLRDQVRLDRAL